MNVAGEEFEFSRPSFIDVVAIWATLTGVDNQLFANWAGSSFNAEIGIWMITNGTNSDIGTHKNFGAILTPIVVSHMGVGASASIVGRFLGFL
jgi:hypothetical protein